MIAAAALEMKTVKGRKDIGFVGAFLETNGLSQERQGGCSGSSDQTTWVANSIQTGQNKTSSCHEMMQSPISLRKVP